MNQEATGHDQVPRTVSVAIVGSCVTRDAFELAPPGRFVIEHYSARTGLGSFLGPAPAAFTPDLEAIASSFQRRMVQWDLQKSGRYWLSCHKPDVVIYDPIDERFALGVAPDGGVMTVSSEFQLMKVPADRYRRIDPWSDEHFARWRAGWASFMRLLRQAELLERLVVHLAYWATEVQGTGEVPGNAEEIARANAWLERAEAVMRQYLPPSQFVRVSQGHTVVDGQHKWGISPFHYVNDYYVDFLGQLEAVLAARPDLHEAEKAS